MRPKLGRSCVEMDLEFRERHILRYCDKWVGLPIAHIYLVVSILVSKVRQRGCSPLRLILFLNSWLGAHFRFFFCAGRRYIGLSISYKSLTLSTSCEVVERPGHHCGDDLAKGDVACRYLLSLQYQLTSVVTAKYCDTDNVNVCSLLRLKLLRQQLING